MRLTKVCPHPGCPELQPCTHHTPKPWAGSQRRQRINKTGWQQQTDARRILRRHHRVCHWCGRPGADQVDHVVPIAEGGADTDDNKRPIHSRPCHDEKTKTEAARARRRSTS